IPTDPSHDYKMWKHLPGIRDGYNNAFLRSDNPCYRGTIQKADFSKALGRLGLPSRFANTISKDEIDLTEALSLGLKHRKELRLAHLRKGTGATADIEASLHIVDSTTPPTSSSSTPTNNQKKTYHDRYAYCTLYLLKELENVQELLETYDPTKYIQTPAQIHHNATLWNDVRTAITDTRPILGPAMDSVVERIMSVTQNAPIPVPSNLSSLAHYMILGGDDFVMQDGVEDEDEDFGEFDGVGEGGGGGEGGSEVRRGLSTRVEGFGGVGGEVFVDLQDDAVHTIETSDDRADGDRWTDQARAGKRIADRWFGLKKKRRLTIGASLHMMEEDEEDNAEATDTKPDVSDWDRKTMIMHILDTLKSEDLQSLLLTLKKSNLPSPPTFLGDVGDPVVSQQMPEEYANLVNQVYCNDCGKSVYAQFGYTVHKCMFCAGYNTKVVRTLAVREVPDGEEIVEGIGVDEGGGGGGEIGEERSSHEGRFEVASGGGVGGEKRGMKMGL
ncbi:hypothetical protein HK097_010144, partial [Rhizophlyctis rosea]